MAISHVPCWCALRSLPSTLEVRLRIREVRRASRRGAFEVVQTSEPDGTPLPGISHYYICICAPDHAAQRQLATPRPPEDRVRRERLERQIRRDQKRWRRLQAILSTSAPGGTSPLTYLFRDIPTAGEAGYAHPVTLLTALIAFVAEHRRRGELDGGLERGHVWMPANAGRTSCSRSSHLPANSSTDVWPLLPFLPLSLHAC